MTEGRADRRNCVLTKYANKVDRTPIWYHISLVHGASLARQFTYFTVARSTGECIRMQIHNTCNLQTRSCTSDIIVDIFQIDNVAEFLSLSFPLLYRDTFVLANMREDVITKTNETMRRKTRSLSPSANDDSDRNALDSSRQCHECSSHIDNWIAPNGVLYAARRYLLNNLANNLCGASINQARVVR